MFFYKTIFDLLFYLLQMSEGQTEYKVRLPPRNERKNFHIMKFRSAPANDPTKWTQVRMVRENNKKEYKGINEDMPKFGAGSEFGREEREEARRKKFGYNRKRYDPDMQPWLMRIGGKKEGKHFRGQREGGVSDNTTFYVFTHAADGSMEAYPIKEWYNFVPRVAYKTLDAEEAEEQFAKRDKILNHWSMILSKKLKPGQDDDDLDLDEDEKKKKGKGKKSNGKKEKDFKISDMDDDWDHEAEEDDLDTDTDEESDKKKKKKTGGDDDSDQDTKKKSKKKKSKEDVDNEAFEDSDDGEGEGREVDYMSDESSEDEDVVEANHDIAGVDQDEGLAKMLDSDESDSEEEKDNEKEDNAEEKDEKKAEDQGPEASSSGKSRNGSPAPEASDEKTNRAEKRKALVDKVLDGTPNDAKRGRFEASSSAASVQPALGSIEASFEEDVRRYLARKSMTTTEISKKMRQKRPDMSRDQLMTLLANAIKRIKPIKKKIKGTLYLSLEKGK